MRDCAERCAFARLVGTAPRRIWRVGATGATSDPGVARASSDRALAQVTAHSADRIAGLERV